MRGQWSVNPAQALSTHMNAHGIQIGTYRQALKSNTIDLLRAEHGFTTILNQCGWCLRKYDTSQKLGMHRRKCEKKPVEFNDRLKELNQDLTLDLTDYYTWLVELLKRAL